MKPDDQDETFLLTVEASHDRRNTLICPHDEELSGVLR